MAKSTTREQLVEEIALLRKQIRQHESRQEQQTEQTDKGPSHTVAIIRTGADSGLFSTGAGSLSGRVPQAPSNSIIHRATPFPVLCRI